MRPRGEDLLAVESVLSGNLIERQLYKSLRAQIANSLRVETVERC